MSLADIIQIAIATLTLIATVAVSFSIYWLQRRHEKEAEKIEKKYRKRELEEKAKLFLMDNEEERDYLSWCVLAANLHRLQKHKRKIYTNYCRCTPELQKEILKQAGFNISFPEDSAWKGRCFDRLRVDIEKYQLGRDCLYDGAKYFFRGYEYYKELPWNETPHLFQPICKKNCVYQIFRKDMINIGSYIDEYFYYYLESHMQFGDNNPEPPIDYVWDSQGLGYAEESVVCMWIMELVQEISIMLYNKYHNEKTDTIDLLDDTGAIPETYEDKYYAALQSLYNTYYTGDWRENGSEHNDKL